MRNAYDRKGSGRAGDDLLEAGLSQLAHDRQHIVCQLLFCFLSDEKVRG